MALIKCIECDREISDKAAACPGCGCPVVIDIAEQEVIDFSGFDKSEPIIRCGNCGYVGNVSKSNLINHGARAQCPKCKSVTFTSILDSNSLGTISANALKTKSSNVNGRTPGCSDNVGKNCSAIPTHGGLAALAFIMGCGVLGGIALGSHFRTKKLIANGEYDDALKASSTTFVSSMLIIVGIPILAVIIIFGMPH